MGERHAAVSPPLPVPHDLRPGGRFAGWAGDVPAYAVLDVDGTVLGLSESPTRAVLDAIDRAATAGLRLGFATGRMRAAVEPLWELTRLPGPHILHNGALVRMDGVTVASWPLPPPDVATTLDLCRANGWYAELYVGDGYLVTDRREDAAVHWHMLHQPPAGLADELDPAADEVLKITIAIFDGRTDTAVETLRHAGLHVGAATSPQASGVGFINVTDADVDKGRALRRAAEHLGIDLPRVVAIGDGGNDLPMLEVAGTAIAMGQALDDVRAAAHLLTGEVAADGLAGALVACARWRDRC